MAHPALSLQKLIYEKLVVSPGLVSILGGERIFDALPEIQAPPFIAFGKSIHRDWSTGNESGLEHEIMLQIWSDTKGRKECFQIADIVSSGLAELAGHIDGSALVNFAHQFTEIGIDSESGMFLAEMNFRAVTEPV